MTAFARCSRLLPAFLSLLVLAALAPNSAHADAFSEFRIPDHRWSSWTADLQGNASRESRDFEIGGGPSLTDPWLSSSELRRSQGRFRTILEQGRERDDLFFLGRAAITVDANAEERRERTVNPFLQSLRHRTEGTDGNLFLTARLRTYPGSGPLGLEINADARGSLEEGWREQEEQQQSATSLVESWSRAEQDGHRVQAFGGAAVGIGRVRDATGVYDAHLLEDRLRETGALSGPLSPAVRRRLAELFYLGSSISIVHDRPDKFFWREVERVLHDDPATGSLDAWSLYRARDVRRLARPIGFFIGPEVGIAYNRFRRELADQSRITLTDSSGTQHFTSSSTSDQEQDDELVTIGGRAEVHVPLGLRFQIDASSRLRYATDEPHTLYLQSVARGVYLLGDRWYADIFASHDRLAPEDVLNPGVVAPAHWQVTWGGSVSYFIEDTWSAEVRLDSGRQHIDHGESGEDQRFSRVSVGISYRISGRLASPALSEPMTPYRPQIYY